MRPTILLDSETTSLTPDYETGAGVIWELAIIEWGTEAEHLWRTKPDLARADPAALGVGKFYERTAGMCEDCRPPKRAYDILRTAPSQKPEWSQPEALASETARLLDGATVIAANPTFDASFLAAFLRANGHAPTWHYRLRDIGSMAWGYLNGAEVTAREVSAPEDLIPLLPIDASTDDFARALGVDPAQFERHSALGDCRLLAAMLDVITGGTS